MSQLSVHVSQFQKQIESLTSESVKYKGVIYIYLLSLFLCFQIEITLRLILYAIMWLGRFVHVNKNANVKRVILVTLCFKIFMILLMDDDWFLKLCANLYVDPIAS